MEEPGLHPLQDSFEALVTVMVLYLAVCTLIYGLLSLWMVLGDLKSWRQRKQWEKEDRARELALIASKSPRRGTGFVLENAEIGLQHDATDAQRRDALVFVRNALEDLDDPHVDF